MNKKISVYATLQNKTHYLYSTNRAKTCKEAIAKIKESIEKPTITGWSSQDLLERVKRFYNNGAKFTAHFDD